MTFEAFKPRGMSLAKIRFFTEKQRDLAVIGRAWVRNSDNKSYWRMSTQTLKDLRRAGFTRLRVKHSKRLSVAMIPL